MKKTSLIVLLLIGLLSGCAREYGMVNDLRQSGVQRSNTTKLLFQGSEADFGPETMVMVSDKRILDYVWSIIEQSKPWGVYSACGSRTIGFFTEENQTIPVAKICVMCSGAWVDGFDSPERMEWNQQFNGRKGLFVCPGLDEYIMDFLKEEYERKHSP